MVHDDRTEKVSLELGSGGRMMRDFLAGRVIPAFGNPFLGDLPDSSHLPPGIAFTTDSYVVDPIFFPGGDIGSLAVNGTVNDLVVSGAEPRYISMGVILEEGLPWKDLDRVFRSIRHAARRAGVLVVTGDTKVVRRGQADKIFINTSGIGLVVAKPRPRDIRPGDELILTGTLGEHSMAVMLARDDFGFEAKVRSDCAPLNYLLPLWKKGVLWMRDITRGGLATILSELAEKLHYSILVDEEAVPLSRAVRGAAEILGIDPLYLACEGRAVLVVRRNRSRQVLQALKKHPLGRRAAVAGRVDDKTGRPGELLLRTVTGGLRLLEPLTSELLPRIC
ncbi:MAG: hydrogenase expression/formation protein HypE [Candidatus Aminicenantes bacterium]|nr:hydrogenase expression/formation protein HypE [Candidatus Aminicenantes bacterium]